MLQSCPDTAGYLDRTSTNRDRSNFLQSGFSLFFLLIKNPFFLIKKKDKKITIVKIAKSKEKHGGMKVHWTGGALCLERPLNRANSDDNPFDPLQTTFFRSWVSSRKAYAPLRPEAHNRPRPDLDPVQRLEMVTGFIVYLPTSECML